MDPVLKGLNNFDVKDCIAPVLGEFRNFVVRVLDIQSISLFSQEFLAHHTSLFGGVNHDLYFIILRELYDTVQRSTMLQHDIEAVYTEIDAYFTDVLLETMLVNYADTTDTFQDSFNSLGTNEDYLARLDHLSGLNRQLMSFVEMYRDNLARTASLLEQVQRINPDFALHPHPENVTMDVSVMT